MQQGSAGALVEAGAAVRFLMGMLGCAAWAGWHLSDNATAAAGNCHTLLPSGSAASSKPQPDVDVFVKIAC